MKSGSVTLTISFMIILILGACERNPSQSILTEGLPILTDEQAKSAAESLLALGEELPDNKPNPATIIAWHGLLRYGTYCYISATDIQHKDGKMSGGFVYMPTWDNKWVIRKVEFSRGHGLSTSTWNESVYFPVTQEAKLSKPAENKLNENSEAEAFVEQEVKKRMLICGDSWFFIPEDQSLESFMLKQYTNFQVKNVKFLASSKALTPADKANGIEWHGTVLVTPEMSRRFCFDTFWQEWEDGWGIIKEFGDAYGLSVKKEKGVWSIFSRIPENDKNTNCDILKGSMKE